MKTKCKTLGEDDNGSGVIFMCTAMNIFYGEEGYAGCDFTDGYKNRCPHRVGQDCISDDARKLALDVLGKCVEISKIAIDIKAKSGGQR